MKETDHHATEGDSMWEAEDVAMVMISVVQSMAGDWNVRKQLEILGASNQAMGCMKMGLYFALINNDYIQRMAVEGEWVGMTYIDTHISRYYDKIYYFVHWL